MANLNRVRKLKSSRIFMLWDIPVFAVITILIVVLLIAAFTQPQGETVVVYVQNAKAAEYSLSNNTEARFQSSDGKYSLIMRIKDSKVTVVDADCPDKLCEQSPAISRVHQSIVCLPAGIVVRIEGKSQIDGII